MSRTCLACRHEEREEIDIQIGRLAPVRHIAELFALPPSTIQRHKGHLPARIHRALERESEHAAGDLLETVRRVLGKMDALTDRMDKRTDDDGIDRLIRAGLAVGRLAEVLGKMRGDVTEQAAAPPVQVNVGLSVTYAQALPPWRQAQIEEGEEAAPEMPASEGNGNGTGED